MRGRAAAKGNQPPPCSAEVCVLRPLPEIIQASNNERTPARTNAHAATRSGSKTSRLRRFSGGRERKTDHDELAHILQNAGRNAPRPAAPRYRRRRSEPFVMYGNQAAALIVQLQSGSGSVWRRARSVEERPLAPHHQRGGYGTVPPRHRGSAQRDLSWFWRPTR